MPAYGTHVVPEVVGAEWRHYMKPTTQWRVGQPDRGISCCLCIAHANAYVHAVEARLLLDAW